MPRRSWPLFDRTSRAPEPWSPAARSDRAAGERAIQARAWTSAFYRLSNAMADYAQGYVSGRSFLIAGHRGAGKTTTVLAALQEIYNRSLAPNGEIADCRPLLVRVNAPSLLVPPATKKEDKNEEKKEEKSATKRETLEAKATADTPADSSGTSAVADLGVNESDLSLRLLQEMAAGILPALVEELRRLMIARAPSDSGPVPSFDPEIVAHLCDTLQRYVHLAELRDLFRRLELLPAGLFRDTGWRAFEQLTAIHAANEAYLIVTGKLESKSDAQEKGEAIAEAKVQQAIKAEDLLRALTLLAATVAAGVGFSANKVAPGLLTAFAVLVAGFIYSSSSSRKLTQTAANLRSFSQDNTHLALVRRVPLLVEQLRMVGFPILFVVDEFDKVRDARALLLWLLSNIKSYVTERAFICFIVERDYFSFIKRAQGRSEFPPTPASPSTSPPPSATPPPPFTPPPTPSKPQPSTPPRPAPSTSSAPGQAQTKVTERYSKEHTFYSDLAYVVIFPDALHEFVRRLFNEDERPQRAIKFARLRHVLLHLSRMHAYDLKQELEQADEAGARQRIENDRLLPSTWRCHAFLQLCIEWVISDIALARRTASDTFFMQLCYDVLYGLTATWQAKTPLSLSNPLGQVGEPVQDHVGFLADECGLTEGDSLLLREAARALVGLLSAENLPPEQILDPNHPSLFAQVMREPNVERLRQFLIEGERASQESELQAALSELRSLMARQAIPPNAVSPFARFVAHLTRNEPLATEKYRLLKELSEEFAMSSSARQLLRATPNAVDEYAWTRSEAGELPGDTRLDEGPQVQLEWFDELRARLLRVAEFGEQRGHPAFASLWAMATGSTADLDSFDKNRGELGTSTSAKEIVEQFLARAPMVLPTLVTIQVTQAVLVAVRDACTARQRLEHEATPAQYRRPPLPTVEALLSYAITGTEPIGRRAATRQLLDLLIRAFGVTLSETDVKLLESANDADDQLKLLRLATETPKVARNAPENELYEQWSTAAAEQIRASLELQLLTADEDARCRRLNVVARLSDWLPDTLAVQLFLNWVSPSSWTIIACRELLSDPPEARGKVGSVPNWLRAVAAAQLNWRELVEKALAGSDTGGVTAAAAAAQPPKAGDARGTEPVKGGPSEPEAAPDPVSRILTWVRGALPRMHDLPSVLVLNPGELLRSWLPSEQLEVMCLQAKIRSDGKLESSEGLTRALRKAVFVFSDTVQKPLELPQQLAVLCVVKPADGTNPPRAVLRVIPAEPSSFFIELFGARTLNEAVVLAAQEVSERKV